MAIPTGGTRSAKPEGGVWFWSEDDKHVQLSISDPQLENHSAIVTLPDGDMAEDLLAALRRLGRKTGP